MILVFRDARRGDEATIARAVRGVAAAEGLLDTVAATEADYTTLLFGDGAALRCLIAELEGAMVGLGLWYPVVSTYAGRRGIRIEDLFVEPDRRSQGVGRALVAEFARRAAQGGYDSLQWSVKNDNIRALAFYRRLGAQTPAGFTSHRLAGAALAALAAN